MFLEDGESFSDVKKSAVEIEPIPDIGDFEYREFELASELIYRCKEFERRLYRELSDRPISKLEELIDYFNQNITRLNEESLSKLNELYSLYENLLSDVKRFKRKRDEEVLGLKKSIKEKESEITRLDCELSEIRELLDRYKKYSENLERKESFNLTKKSSFKGNLIGVGLVGVLSFLTYLGSNEFSYYERYNKLSPELEKFIETGDFSNYFQTKFFTK